FLPTRRKRIAERARCERSPGFGIALTEPHPDAGAAEIGGTEGLHDLARRRDERGIAAETHECPSFEFHHRERRERAATELLHARPSAAAGLDRDAPRLLDRRPRAPAHAQLRDHAERSPGSDQQSREI